MPNITSRARPASGYEEIRYDVDEGLVTITLNREERRNTITYPTLDELLDAFTRADEDPDVRAIVVTGAGSFFSSGTELRSGGGGMDADAQGYKPLRGGRRDVGGELSLRIYGSNKPVIGAINGTAVGIGVTMILPMDVRVASSTARFGLPFARRGIVPESCSSWFLPRIVGISKALDWTMTGRIFGADEALAAGLVGELCPAEDVLDRARAIGREIATQTSAVSVAMTRQMLWRQLGAPGPIDANRLESAALLDMSASADAAEGVAAFKEKRPPTFTLRVPDDLPSIYPWWDEEPFETGD
jgi:enoyl-CoA hydratase/carnithine racemase